MPLCERCSDIALPNYRAPITRLYHRHGVGNHAADLRRAASAALCSEPPDKSIFVPHRACRAQSQDTCNSGSSMLARNCDIQGKLILTKGRRAEGWPMMWRGTWKKPLGGNDEQVEYARRPGRFVLVELPASAQAPDAQDRCEPDVMRLCSQFTSDRDRIVPCLKRNRSKLSKSCLSRVDLDVARSNAQDLVSLSTGANQRADFLESGKPCCRPCCRTSLPPAAARRIYAAPRRHEF